MCVCANLNNMCEQLRRCNTSDCNSVQYNDRDGIFEGIDGLINNKQTYVGWWINRSKGKKTTSYVKGMHKSSIMRQIKTYNPMMYYFHPILKCVLQKRTQPDNPGFSNKIIISFGFFLNNVKPISYLISYLVCAISQDFQEPLWSKNVTIQMWFLFLFEHIYGTLWKPISTLVS